MEGSTTTLPVPADSHSRGSSRAPSAPRREETRDSEKAGRVWCREAEDDPWSPCILTLDGGGIRGYSSLLILQALMHEVWKWEKYYDEEEAETITGVRTDSPVEDRQAETGAPRGRSGPHLEEESETAQENHVPMQAPLQNVTTDQTGTPTLRSQTAEEDLLPCHYFDFMYGTSTGGLIATILGRLRMTVAEGLELYRKVGDDLFGKRRSNIPLKTKYYHEPLEKAVRDIVKKRCHEHDDCDGNDMHPWDCDKFVQILEQTKPFDVEQPRVCQSCCLTAAHDGTITEAHLLRSYPHYYTEATPNWVTRYNEGADMLPIWQVTRATTAAPFYFDMVTAVVNDIEKAFKDGGIRENNPSNAALSEFHSLYEGKYNQPALMLSVGTGRPNQEHDGFATTWPTWGRIPMVAKFMERRAVIQNLLIKYTEGEKQHKVMQLYAHGENTWYKRLNVSTGFENMPLDDWQRGEWTDPVTGKKETVPGGLSLSKMEDATDEYLTRPYDPNVDSYAPPSTMLNQAARKLVLQRRMREKLGGKRWDYFVGKHIKRPEVPSALKGDSG